MIDGQGKPGDGGDGNAVPVAKNAMRNDLACLKETRPIRLAIFAAVLSTVSAGAAAEPQPRVLILGDSISIGYTPHVQELMEGEAEVLRPMRPNGNAENCSGTTYGVTEIDRWLEAGGGKWAVIHFNFGLHDLKRVDPASGAASGDPNHPRQAEPEAYERNLRQIVERLKKTGARLVFATTTPVPEGKLSPHRDPEDVERYNEIARRVMEENGVAIDDLYGFALPRLAEIQRPANVHFTDDGSKALAEQVAASIREQLKAGPAK